MITHVSSVSTTTVGVSWEFSSRVAPIEERAVASPARLLSISPFAVIKFYNQSQILAKNDRLIISNYPRDIDRWLCPQLERPKPSIFHPVAHCPIRACWGKHKFPKVIERFCPNISITDEKIHVLMVKYQKVHKNLLPSHRFRNHIRKDLTKVCTLQKKFSKPHILVT